MQHLRPAWDAALLDLLDGARAGKGVVDVIDSIRLPVRNRADRFDLGAIADDLERTIDDPLERQVMRAVAADLLEGNLPTSMGEALDLIENASPEARRALLDRGRASAGLSSLNAEQAAEMAANPPLRVSSRPPRDGMGRIEAVCGEPDCRNFLPDPGGQQIARVDCRRWYCELHREGREDAMLPYDGPRLIYAPSGLLVDADEYDAEIRKAKLADAHRESVAAQRAADAQREAEVLRVHAERKREAERLEARHQLGIQA